MRLSGFRAALALAFAAALACAPARAVDPAQQSAPADGWASQAGGTAGGSAAISSNIYTVTNRQQLLAAITNGGTNPKIIKVVGTIDMTEGVPYVNTGDQAVRGAIRLRSNTTLIGDGSSSGFINGSIMIVGVSQVIVRNLKIVNPCDVGPIYDPTDGVNGSYNAAYDGITVSGADHVWIDHNTFTDAPVTDNTLPYNNGVLMQCHDGALDITNASDYVTVSYNVFGQHHKNNLIGNSDSNSGDEGKLRITFSNNVFRDVVSRAPRVRYGQVHLFNNYHVGSTADAIYPNDYAVGAGYNAKILSNANVFEIAGAKSCNDIVVNPGGTATGTYKDTGSYLNGAPLTNCAIPNATTWTPPYAFTVRPISLVKLNALAQAGGGKLTTTISGTGDVTVNVGSTIVCPTTGLWFCDDFQSGSTANWNLLPVSGPNGAFSVPAEISGGTNKVMQYSASSTGGILALLTPSALAKVPGNDYYIEARIKPMTNSTTANKQIYLVARYVDASNWYGAGLNVQSSSASTQVEIAKMAAGALNRPVQVKKPIVMDTTFYTVRFELIGSRLSVYLDGVLIGALTDSSFSARGMVGLFTNNKSFQIDDVRMGDPNVKPVQLNLSPSTTTWAAEAGDPPLNLAVTALKSDGTPDTFTVSSTNPAVATVASANSSITITPAGAGNATILAVSDSDPSVRRSITASIWPLFTQPTQTYTLTNVISPVTGDALTNVDTPLKITFDSGTTPTLGSVGSVHIYRMSDDTTVDIIHLTAESDELGYPGQSLIRKVNTTPISLNGRTLTIRPHQNKLQPGETYYVAIGNGVVNNAILNGTPFVGIGKLGGWSFTTKSTQPSGTAWTVGPDGNSDFSSVQGALNYAMQYFDKSTPVDITIRNGTYEELLYLRGKDNVSLHGESRDGVTLQYKNNDGLNPGAGGSQAPGTQSTPGGGRAVLLVESADMLSLGNFTLKNTTRRAGTTGTQAETMYFNSDAGRLVAKAMNFYSEQDTLNLKGWSWFYQSLVQGNVDFIWGGSHAALFEQSEIRSLGDSASSTSGGYIVQARVPLATDKGYVFLNSTLTHGPGPAGNDVPTNPGVTYLARSPGSSNGTYDNVAYVGCKMDRHIAAVGWYNNPLPVPSAATATAGWREFASTDLSGNLLNVSSRVNSYQLTAADVANGFANRAQIFAGFNGGAGWNPQP